MRVSRVYGIMGLSKTRWNDGTADGTTITNFVGRDGRWLHDNYVKPSGTPVTSVTSAQPSKRSCLVFAVPSAVSARLQY